MLCIVTWRHACTRIFATACWHMRMPSIFIHLISFSKIKTAWRFEGHAFMDCTAWATLLVDENDEHLRHHSLSIIFHFSFCVRWRGVADVRTGIAFLRAHIFRVCRCFRLILLSSSLTYLNIFLCGVVVVATILPTLTYYL